MAGLRSFDAVVRKMTVEEKREMIQRVVERVDWNGEQARLILCGGDDASM